jgi:hypothetical protein
MAGRHYRYSKYISIFVGKDQVFLLHRNCITQTLYSMMAINLLLLMTIILSQLLVLFECEYDNIDSIEKCRTEY